MLGSCRVSTAYLVLGRFSNVRGMIYLLDILTHRNVFQAGANGTMYSSCHGVGELRQTVVPTLLNT